MSASIGIMPKSVSISLSICLLVIAMISIQSGASLAKSLFPLIGPQGLTSLRLGIGTLVLFIIFKPWRMRFNKHNYLPLLIYGLALGGMNFLFYLSLETVPLGIAVALEFTGPLVVAMFSFRSMVDIVWVVIAALGVWLLLLPAGYHANEINFAGALYALGAGVCWAIYILSGQKAGNHHGSASVAAGSFIAAIVFCPVGFAYQGDALLNPAILPVALAVAVLSTVLPYSLEMIALTRLPARIFGTLMSMEPAVAAISGLVFLNEQLNNVQWLALVLIICASTGTSLTVKNDHQKKSCDVV